KEEDFEYGEWQTGIKLTNLNNIIEQKKYLPIPIIRVIMKQILEGLRLMLEQGLFHRNIKEQNILLHSPIGSNSVQIKISDFNLVKAKNDDKKTTVTTVAGNLPFMPPELLLGANEEGDQTKADSKVDIWASGIILHHLVAHCFPFKSTNLLAINKFMKSQRLDRPITIKDNIVWDLITKLLTFDQKKRISASDALNHPFFTGAQAIKEISPLSIQLAQTAQQAKQKGDKSVTIYDVEPSFSLHINEIKDIVNRNPEVEMAEIQKQLKQSSSSKFVQFNHQTHKNKKEYQKK
ncbi:MAG: hypothetical protein EZS28_005989, partial [Streblomastix strix]